MLIEIIELKFDPPHITHLMVSLDLVVLSSLQEGQSYPPLDLERRSQCKKMRIDREIIEKNKIVKF